MTDIADLTHDSFSGLVGTTVTVLTRLGPVALTLDNIKLFSQTTLRDNHLEIDGKVLPPRRAFALTLEGPLEPELPPDTYEIEIGDLGKMVLFLSAFRRDQTCMLYEIAFS